MTAAPEGERFPKSARLRTRQEYLRVQERGTKVSAGCLLALALPNRLGTTRIGFTVSSKVGKAVVRNRVRRRLRELARKRRAALPKGLDVVLIARSSAATEDFAGLSRSFDAIVAKLAKEHP